jgi:hypothetical protein
LADLPTATFKKARVGLPSFSAAKWSKFARQYGLSEDPSFLNLEFFTTPRYRLPSSLHEAMFENAWRWRDVYLEAVAQERVEARLRLLEPVCLPNSWLYALY